MQRSASTVATGTTSTVRHINKPATHNAAKLLPYHRTAIPWTNSWLARPPYSQAPGAYSAVAVSDTAAALSALHTALCCFQWEAWHALLQ